MTTKHHSVRSGSHSKHTHAVRSPKPKKVHPHKAKAAKVAKPKKIREGHIRGHVTVLGK